MKKFYQRWHYLEVKTMYKTIAFRNMKRQLRNYVVYFVTISMTISLVFAMNNMIYNKNLQARAESFSSLAVGLLILSGFLCVIIAMILGYANAYILRLRKREFGTYLTLGMKRYQIVKLFLLENSFLGIFAIVTGFIFGSLLYQGLMLLMSKLLEYSFSFSFVSAKGVMTSLMMTVLIFVITFISSGIYLKRVTIYDLIHGENKVHKVQRKPILSAFLTLISAITIVYALTNFSTQLEGVFKEVSGSDMRLLWMIVLFAVALIIFHIGLAKSLMYVLIKRKKFTQKGTNLFILRQLSATLNSNAILLGFLAFLIAFAIIASNVGFLYKAVEEVSIEKRYPFDVMGIEVVNEKPAISVDQAEQIIKKYVTIEHSFKTPFFTSGKVDFLKHTSWYDEEFKDRDLYVRESDFNQLLKALGKEPVHLDHEYAIYSNDAIIHSFNFKNQYITHNGETYTLKYVKDFLPAFVWAYFVIVVPDEVVEGMKHIQTAYAWDVKKSDFDAVALKQKLSYKESFNHSYIQLSDYRIKNYGRLYSMFFSAILIVGALYIGFVFILLAMAILALKTLSGIHEDEKRYHILHQIGVSKTLQQTTLAKQIFTFFAFPVAIPVVLSIPIAFISNKFIQLLGFQGLISIPLLSIVIVAVIILIYFIYFIVTFEISKKYVLTK